MTKHIDRKFSEVISLFNSGKFIEAKELAKKILRLDSNNSNIMEMLCLINLKLENFIEAHKFISDAMKIKKDYLSHNYLGQVYYKMKNYDEAINNFNISIKLNNNVHVTYVNRGSVFEDLEEFEKAIEDYKKAIEINPKAYQAYNNIGNIYTKIGKFDEAIKNLQIATLSNEFLPFYNLGCLFNRLNKNEEAIKSFNKSIELNPTHISSYRNRAYTNLRFKKFILAINDYKKIKDIYEESDDGTYLFCKSIINDWEDYEIFINEIIKKIKNKIEIQPFYLLSLLDNCDLQKACCENYILEEKKTDFKINFLKNKKIKLGYFSADFNNHAVTRLLKDVLKFHDKEKFEINCFYFHPYKHDKETKIIKEYSDNFFDLKNYRTNEIVTFARDLNLDIGIDLMGYTEHHRMSIFQERVAPIQINYLGYPGTIGKKFMDYIVADKFLIPEDFKKNYLEKIIYLPDCYQPQYELIDTSNIDFDDKFDLSEEKFIFSNFCKKLGINETRIIFSKRTTYEKHIKRFKHVNLFLDTFPYNGHTTSSEALKSNLLLVTLQGTSFQSRVSASIINNLKLNQLITNDVEEYIKLSVELANNSNKYNELKKQLKNNLNIESVKNNKIYTKNLESAFEKVYKKKQNNLTNEDIYI